MKVYITRAWDTNEWGAEYLTVGVFSTMERATAAGEYYCKVESEYGSYKFAINEEIIDEYFNKHLSGLAKVLE